MFQKCVCGLPFSIDTKDQHRPMTKIPNKEIQDCYDTDYRMNLSMGYNPSYHLTYPYQSIDSPQQNLQGLFLHPVCKGKTVTL